MINKKIAVAMSGGVDSSVVAAILKEEGYPIIGVTMVISGMKQAANNKKMIEDSKSVADFLGIDHVVVELQPEFKELVIDSFINEYTAGRTPNPCVVCNYNIKFGKLLDKVQELGYEKMATGHYVIQKYNKNTKQYTVHKGKDPNKDQSYMMYTLNQYQLSHTLFPLGIYQKQKIREMARNWNLPVANKPESQDICFIENNDYKEFWQKMTNTAGVSGLIIDPKGNKIGEHTGIQNYTIGQRKGLGVALGYPAYVVNIDPVSHTVMLGPNNMLMTQDLIAKNVNWIAGKPPFDSKIGVKIRYRSVPQEAEIKCLDEDTIKIRFRDSVRAVTPGQSAVFYSGDQLLGGGVIIG